MAQTPTKSKKKTLQKWDFFEDFETTASPAGMTRATAVRIKKFNISERLRNMDRGKKVLTTISSTRLAA